VNTHEIEDEHTLVNKAVIRRTSIACEVCTARGEMEEGSEFQLEFEGQKVQLCDAHAQEVLNLDEDELKKGENIFSEMFD